MFRILKVSGDSLAPDYLDGDFVLMLKIPSLFNPIRKGDLVVFNHPDYGILIKKIDRINQPGAEVYVLGTHPLSVDSRQFGMIPIKDVIGKVIWQVKKPR